MWGSNGGGWVVWGAVPRTWNGHGQVGVAVSVCMAVGTADRMVVGVAVRTAVGTAVVGTADRTVCCLNPTHSPTVSAAKFSSVIK